MFVIRICWIRGGGRARCWICIGLWIVRDGGGDGMGWDGGRDGGAGSGEEGLEYILAFAFFYWRDARPGGVAL